MIRSYRGTTPRLGDGVYVDPSAQVVGDVVLGRGSSVWMNAVLRGDVGPIVLGEESNVQDGSVLHVTRGGSALRIGSRVTLGHGVIAHGCTIEDRVLVGMGACILDGARIGADTIVGARALVPLHSEIPPGSLVLGIPGKVVRSLTAEERESILRYARNYVEYKDSYLEENT